MDKRSKKAVKVSIVTIIVNIILAVFKLLCGIIAKSAALISDAVHTFSDCLSTFAVLIGIRVSSKSPDKEHPYGHERLECIAAIVLAAVLAVTGIGIGYSGVVSIIEYSKDPSAIAVPSYIALIAAGASIVIKELMYWYTRNAAKKENSGLLMADAWHHRSDALSSVGSLIGVGGAMLGVTILDPIASLIICLFILKAAFDVSKDAMDKMVDKSCGEETIQTIKDIVLRHSEITGIDSLKTRQFGDKAYVELEISADENLSFTEAHNICDAVHDEIEEALKIVKHCTVHISPSSGAVSDVDGEK